MSVPDSAEKEVPVPVASLGYIKCPFKGFLEIKTITDEIFLLSVQGLSVRKTSAYVHVAHNSSNADMEVFIKFSSEDQGTIEKWYEELSVAIKEASQ